MVYREMQIKTEALFSNLPLSGIMFSWILLAETSEERERIRKDLIDNFIYPAVLWNIPETSDKEVVGFSKRMLSIHCDGRYSDEYIQEMSKRLKLIIGND